MASIVSALTARYRPVLPFLAVGVCKSVKTAYGAIVREIHRKTKSAIIMMTIVMVT